MADEPRKTMADVPWATVKVRHKLGDIRKSECNVYVDGRVVAKLPTAGIKWEKQAGSQQTAYLILTLLAEEAAVDTLEIETRPHKEDPANG